MASSKICDVCLLLFWLHDSWKHFCLAWFFSCKQLGLWILDNAIIVPLFFSHVQLSKGCFLVLLFGDNCFWCCLINRWWAPSKFDPVKSPMLFFENGQPVIPPIPPDAGLDKVLNHMVWDAVFFFILNCFFLGVPW